MDWVTGPTNSDIQRRRELRRAVGLTTFMVLAVLTPMMVWVICVSKMDFKSGMAQKHLAESRHRSVVDSLNYEIARRDSIIHSMQEKVK